MPTDALATGTHRVAFGPVADFVEAAAGVGASPTALSGTLAPALTASYPRKSLVSRGHSEVDEREAEAVAGAAHQDLKGEAPVIAQQRLDGIEVEHELRREAAGSVADGLTRGVGVRVPPHLRESGRSSLA